MKKYKYKTVRKTTKNSKKGRTAFGAFPSKPGQPPRKQTGALRRSITHEVIDGQARVGTNIPYGKMLEFGTSKMRPRPWLRRALREMQSQVNKILTAPMNMGGA
jgi:HK97 gp10 family phage protein